jgi:hypothetical protein
MTPALTRRAALIGAVALSTLRGASAETPQRAPALSDWRDGPAKQTIVDFVARVSRPGPDFVPEPERVAVFDNDGTLWIEQPFYVQGVFALDRAAEMARADPALAAKPPFQAVVSGDKAALAALNEQDIVALMAATHSGMTPEAFRATAAKWLAEARHPRFGVPYTRLIYAPQVQLMDYLRAHGFTTWIVSGGGVDFMRAFAQPAYGVPPEQVIGSSARTRFESAGARADLIKTGEPESLDDKDGKPRNINLRIGRRPILAVGNSDGDLAMLQYAAGSSRPNLEVLIHHDDAAREYAYDRASRIGTLDKALEEAVARQWVVVSMKRDWANVFPG